MNDDGLWNFRGGRHEIIGKGAAQKAAVRRIRKFFEQRRAKTLTKATADLAIDHPRMQNCAAVVHRHVAIDAGLAGDAVDFHAAKIEYEAVTYRRIDVVLVVRGSQ